MSFDLWVWREEEPVTAREALLKYRWMVSEEERSGPEPEMVPDGRVGEFYDDVCGVYPPLELADGESPWSMSPFLVPDNYVALSMRYAEARDAAPAVIEMAMRHGLVCFDPQSVHVHNPPGIVDSDGPHLFFCDGGTVNRPLPEDLPRLLREITEDNWFACLEVRPEWYVQVGLGKRAGGAPDGAYGIEYREGSSDRHFRHVTDDFDAVVSAFRGFAEGHEDWKAEFTRLELS